MQRSICAIAVLCLLSSCESGGPLEDNNRRIEVVGPAEQTGTPLDTLAELLAVRVTDQLQRPLAGAAVTWSAGHGGSIVPEAPTTDAQGIARARWILGWQTGAQQANATAGADASATFTATAEGFQATALSVGDGEHQCGINSGALYCWGPNDDGQLGDGSTANSEVPVLAQVNGPITQAVTGYSPIAGDFTCALTSSGEVYCWGANDTGQLGNGSSSPSLSPVRVQLPPTSFKALSARGGGACALSTGGEAYCWGYNHFARFGTGSTENPLLTPAPIAGGLRWRQIGLGDDRACGVREGGQVYCWGAWPEWLGTGVDTNTVAPLPVTNAPLMDSITVSGWHQCGITAQQVTYCWGSNHNIGVEDPRNVIPDPIPLAVPPAVRSIHSGYDPTFALDLDGKGYWWGPPHGATGGPPLTPEPFSGDIPLTAIGLTGSGVCGIEASTATVYCWSLFSWGGPERLTAPAKP